MLTTLRGREGQTSLSVSVLTGHHRSGLALPRSRAAVDVQARAAGPYRGGAANRSTNAPRAPVRPAAPVAPTPVAPTQPPPTRGNGGNGPRDAADLWYAKLDAVVDFQRRNGSLPSRESADAREQELGAWCHLQHQRKAGKKGTIPLSPEQEDSLVGIPGWIFTADVEAEKWGEMLQALTAFVADSARLPAGGKPKASDPAEEQERKKEEAKLASWCADQRRRFKDGKLSEQQMAALEQVPGWWWDKAEIEAETWEAYYGEIANWGPAHGRLPRTSEGANDPLEDGEAHLGRWIAKQRQAHKKGLLSADQVQRLEALPGWYWPEEKKK